MNLAAGFLDIGCRRVQVVVEVFDSMRFDSSSAFSEFVPIGRCLRLLDAAKVEAAVERTQVLLHPRVGESVRCERLELFRAYLCHLPLSHAPVE